MRFISSLHKKSPFYTILPLLIVIIIGITMPHFAHADILPDWMNPISWIGWVIIGVFYVIQTILIVFLFIVSFIVDNIFIFNVVLNPNNMPAVIGGWKVMRDISNSLFLLILLWIAIQIIWGFGGENKRLLVRLIIVAFLINFSLAFTGAAFGFGNALAKPFRDKIGNDVAGWIINKTKLNTVQTGPSAQGTQSLWNATPSNKDCLLNQLTNTTVPLECPEKTMDANKVMAIVAGGASGIAQTVTGNPQIKEAMQMGIANIFLILIIIMFGGVAGFLTIRIVMMAFLGVLSPAAFFLSAIPMKGAKSLFDRWLRNLIGWSFIAPCFYFLFYVSLLMLDAMTSSPMTKISGDIPFAANVFAMLPMVIFLVFLGATMSTCKKLGAEVADAAINMGKLAAGVALTAAAGVATGGVSLAGGALARGAGTAVTGTTNWVAEKPILGRITAPITRRVHGYYQKRTEDIDKMKEGYNNIPTRQLTQQLKTTLSADKKIAMADILHSRRGSDGYTDFDKLDDNTQLKVMGYENQLGRKNFLKARLDQATKSSVPGARDDYDAKKKIASGMTPEEKTKISKNALADDDTKKAILETSTKADMESIVRYNADMTQQLIYGFFHQNEQMMRGIMKQETLQFIYGNMRIQAGARRPAPAPVTPPAPTPAPGTTTPTPTP